jgi:capsular exopolysaccharide synthesis family protein
MTETNPLARYLDPLRRWWIILACAAVLGAVVAWVTLPDPPPDPEDAVVIDPSIDYRATHILVRGRPTPTTTNFDLVVLLAQQGEVTARVLARIGEDFDQGDIEAVELLPDTNLGTLSVVAVQPLPERAEGLATAYAEEITAYFDERAAESTEELLQQANARLTAFSERITALEEEIQDLPVDGLDRRLRESEVEVLIEQYGALQAEARALNAEALGAGSTFDTLQEPVAVSTASQVGTQILDVAEDAWVRAAIALVGALLLGVVLVFVVDWADTRVRTRRDAEEAFGLPVIAEVPRRRRAELTHHPLPVITEPGSVTAEAFRSLRLAVMVGPRWRLGPHSPTGGGSVGTATPTSDRSKLRTVLVTSTGTGEGKSTVVANLAASLAESGQRVLVLDCDFRRSTVADLLDAGQGRGLRSLTDLEPGSVASLAVPTAVPNVGLVRTGTAGVAPPWLFLRASELLDQALDMAEVVVVDTGPLTQATEASALIPSVDAVLLVNRSGRVTVAAVRRTIEQLTRLAAQVVGIVTISSEGQRRYGYQELTPPQERRESVWP